MRKLGEDDFNEKRETDETCRSYLPRHYLGDSVKLQWTKLLLMGGLYFSSKATLTRTGLWKVAAFTWVMYISTQPC